MKRYSLLLLLVILLLAFSSCQQQNSSESVRKMIDTVGFATKKYQMDSILNRIYRNYSENISQIYHQKRISDTTRWKTSISPHDDYSYASYLYPISLSHIRSDVVILMGVAHKAKDYNLENKIIFDDFDYWQTPYGKVRVHKLRNEIRENLSKQAFVTNNQIQKTEHSLEAIVPFIKYYNAKVEIVPILVPYMDFKRMQDLASELGKTLAKIAEKNEFKWSEDFSIVISTDAVHYGNEDWGGKNFAEFGVDEEGYKKAINKEKEIMNTCFNGELNPDKARKFFSYTVKKDNYKEYKWTWCGRYSVPFGMLTSFYLNQELSNNPLKGIALEYANSIDHAHLKVEDIRMGHTAPANKKHWVGYASAAFY